MHDVPFVDLSRLLPHMHMLEVEAKEVLHQAGEPVGHIFFPLTALMSMLMPTSDGATVELATVGREGLTDTSVLLDGSTARDHGALAKVITVIPGTVIRMKSDVLKAAAESSLSVSRCLCQYVSRLFTELALSVTCNRLHSLAQRCARWLLTAMDKSDRQAIPVTQEILAGILGVSRQSVVHTLRGFETEGWIQCGRGSIRVAMRSSLTKISCECYSIGKKRAAS